MDSKMVVGLGLMFSLVLSISLLALPALAEVNGTNAGNQVQDQERLGVQDCSGDGDTLHERERLRLHEHNCHSECTGSQHRERQRAENRMCNNEANCEQCRHQHRK